jgi:hypothetical protein
MISTLAYPTIVQQQDGSLKELDEKAAAQYALKTGEYKRLQMHRKHKPMQMVDTSLKNNAPLNRKTDQSRTSQVQHDQRFCGLRLLPPVRSNHIVCRDSSHTVRESQDWAYGNRWALSVASQGCSVRWAYKGFYAV